MPAPATIFEIRKNIELSKKKKNSKMPIVRRCWDPWSDGPSGGRIPAAATIFAISKKMISKKNEQKIHISPAPLPNRDRRGAGQIPAPATIFKYFLARFGTQLADRAPDALVACGPHSTRPKDCPGLGYPNTLKSHGDRHCFCVFCYT